MKPNLILMSHGNLASALIEATKMVLGDLSNYDAIDMKTEDTFVEVEEKLKNLLEQYKDKYVIIFFRKNINRGECYDSKKV